MKKIRECEIGGIGRGRCCNLKVDYEVAHWEGDLWGKRGRRKKSKLTGEIFLQAGIITFNIPETGAPDVQKNPHLKRWQNGERKLGDLRGPSIAGDPVGSYKGFGVDIEQYGEPLEGWTWGIA